VRFNVTEGGGSAVRIIYHAYFPGSEAVAIGNRIAGALLMGGNGMVIGIIFVKVLGNVFIWVVYRVPR